MKTNYVFTYEFQNIDVIKYKTVADVTNRHFNENKINLFVRITDIKDVELTDIV